LPRIASDEALGSSASDCGRLERAVSLDKAPLPPTIVPRRASTKTHLHPSFQIRSGEHPDAPARALEDADERRWGGSETCVSEVDVLRPGHGFSLKPCRDVAIGAGMDQHDLVHLCRIGR